MDLEQLATPALVLDRARLVRNTRAMTARAAKLGVRLRPHMKTAKSADVAGVATDGNFGGITVATLKEAEYFLASGFNDITYAVPVVPAKLDRAAALVSRGADLKLITDNVDVAAAIAAHGSPLKVLIEIDTGDHRTGIVPDAPELVQIGRILDAADAAKLEGVLTHAGQSYSCRGAEEMAAVAEAERAGVVEASERLADAGLPCPVVSTGSTPCVMFARDLTGITEVRPGVYMLGDLFQAGIGTCPIDDIAVSVLASVIAHRRDENRLLIDAGGLALSKDRATQALDNDCGFGLVCDAATAEPFPGLSVESVHQEHGMVTADGPMPFDRLPVGGKVRVFPNHVCMTAAAYDAYNVIESGEGGGGDGDGDGDGIEVTAVWERCGGW